MVRVQVGQEDSVDVFEVRVPLDGPEGTAAEVHDDLPLAFTVVRGQQIARRRRAGTREGTRAANNGQFHWMRPPRAAPNSFTVKAAGSTKLDVLA
ncbi:hypothetical protein AHiyo8_57000 [Arthrobacter sp. Hiyo8]|nr:hypothetical protein AHiyo8_57000 [Arthrobacter sp. Hiyo8]